MGNAFGRAGPKVTDVLGEPEPSEGFANPEANLHCHVECTKNPGHEDFIPVGEFDVEHLPEGYRHEWRVELIKALSELTVYLKVQVASENRPKRFPKSTVGYPFHIPGGGRRSRTGSGFVCNVTRCGDGTASSRAQVCACADYKDSPCPRTKWWELEVATARHVVFDETELADTQLIFFYDSPDSRGVGKKAHKVIDASTGQDYFWFTVLIHGDDEVGQRLDKAWTRYLKVRFDHWRDANPLAVTVSHPHGCSKHVTVGETVKGEEKVVEEVFRKKVVAYRSAQYTAATCPGSSGGVVLAQGVWDHWSFGRTPHSQAMPGGTGRSAGRYLFD